MDKKKVVKFILECVKYIVSAAIGYFGGNRPAGNKITYYITALPPK